MIMLTRKESFSIAVTRISPYISVKEKLRQLGYTHGDLPRWTAGFEKLILQPRPLTTRSA